ncbi:disease resistance protein RGA2-like [Mangifera indica]|uniref:disease resistance protein RGA2-like n=1 Tax=Mangifera indica TaxID=29780 RepID=UPI001CFA12B3|nr:disease resistance protein RGA2-like [Mangifera indica]XP_044508730.1 disease resistance protein RGA2-like [Mangifera indica]
MAEGILFSVAGKILEGLGSLLLQESKLAWGVKDEIQKLIKTVNTIKSTLLDAEEQHNKMNQQVTDWIQRLKDAFYDVDDLVDDFSTELRWREVMTGNKLGYEVRIFFSNYNQIAYSLRMAHKIKTIREKLHEIKNDKQFHFSEHLVEKGVISIERETHSFIRVEKVIGRDNDKGKVIKLVLDSNDFVNVSVVTIVGLGGVGKTTLAQLVYNDENVTNYFQLRMWVCVSEDFTVKTIVEKIIKSATRKELGNFHLNELQEFLRKEIDGKRYLLVLDDVWNEKQNKWDELTDLLMNGSKGSKILVTTRGKVVAKVTSKLESYVYTLTGLDEKKSWSLFTQKAFQHGVEPKDSKLVEIGKGIVGKCGGVPLVIMTIAQLLSGNNKEDDWLNFKENEMSKVIKEESDILPLLKLSYDHLPSNLKQCFAYCALFPKDYKIKKQKLIHLWMAQGFIQMSKRECPENVGDKYFLTLLSGSFFQDPEYDRWGNVVACKMHDLMHDLAQLVAGTECTMQTFEKVESVNVRCRHLSLDCGEVKASWKFPAVLYSGNNIRTLLLFCRLNWGFNLDHGDEILTSYAYLRALDFGGLKFHKLLSSNGKLLSLIGELKHLRYLDVSGVDIRILPNSLSRLVNLETLDLSYCSELVELPRHIKKMVNLRHLINKKCDSLTGMPYGLGHLTNLQTLPLFVVSKQSKRKTNHSGTEELHRLNNLRGKLKIKNLKFEASRKSANLEGKQFLWSLTLDWGRSDDREVQGNEGIDEVEVLEGLKPHSNLKKISVRSFMVVKLCDWLLSLTKLTSISIKKCRRCKHIPPLDKLPCLKTLCLSHLDDLEYISDEANKSWSTLPATFFPSLEQFTLCDCPELKGWWRKHDYNDTELPSFPCLSKLDIQNCPNLMFMPLCPSLVELKLLKTSSKPLQRMMTMTLKNKGEPSTSSCFSAPLSNLKSMLMFKIPDLESLPVDALQNLTALVDLKILSCPKISQLDQALKFLPSLQNREITSYEEPEPEWEDICRMGLRFIPDFG